jgi:hypothetical protein
MIVVTRPPRVRLAQAPFDRGHDREGAVRLRDRRPEGGRLAPVVAHDREWREDACEARSVVHSADEARDTLGGRGQPKILRLQRSPRYEPRDEHARCLVDEHELRPDSQVRHRAQCDELALAVDAE